jgi:hypothetical protein
MYMYVWDLIYTIFLAIFFITCVLNLLVPDVLPDRGKRWEVNIYQCRGRGEALGKRGTSESTCSTVSYVYM